ncbi:MAG: bifunctional serine/threonine-protein kinase/formylglycine-generating enzyme family protein [Planctomycetota bacterium]
MRSLFAKASALPPGQRESFVRAQAGTDSRLRDEVLALLKASEVDTTGLGDPVRQAKGNAAPQQQAEGAPPSGAAGDHVQSTATGELMEKLAKAPKLDEQRYAIETEVGKGGMGAVMRIHDQHLNRRLAMKVLLERSAPRDEEEKRLSHQLLGRFLEEAQVTSQLDHPGVVPVHELGLDQRGKVYFTMRLVKGYTASFVFGLARQESEGWTTTRALEVILKVCDTMAYAHDKGVLHRDLKPANVMVGRFGEVYVMDWGLAKVLGQADRHDLRIRKDEGTGASRIESARQRDEESDAGSSVVSMDGQQLGTPSYMAPEQARSESLDQRADVYAIGAMLYELLTGRVPYVVPGVRKPAYRILDDVVEGPPKRIEEIEKGVPAELVAIVEKAMARDREERYPNVLALAADLRAFLAQRVVKAYRTGALVEMKLWVRRNRALASSLAAAVLILVAGIVGTSLYAAENKALLVEARNSEQKAKDQEAFAKQQEQIATASKNQIAGLLTEAQAEAEKNRIFADVAKLAEAKRLEADLYPAFPDKVPALEAWLRDFGEPLAERLPELEAALVALRAKAKPITDEQRKLAREQHARWPELLRLQSWSMEWTKGVDPLDALQEHIATLENEIEVAGLEFTDRKDAHLHRTLTRLVKEQGEFVRSGVIPGVQRRLETARTLRQKTVDAHQAEWDEAIAAIKASDGVTASKQYGNFVLTAQVGLVPIGMDKDSLLWEFVHMASGTPGLEFPKRDAATKRLIPTDEMGIVFVLLPGGSLPEGTIDEDNKQDTSVRLGVRLDPFFLGKYEMTRGQWLRVTGPNPRSSIHSGTGSQHAFPVADVDWFDSEDVLRHEGLVLPSELQWEYAIRAGTTTRWWTGDTVESVTGKENIASGQLLRVGSKAANGFGLFDMGGNVSEWCLDVDNAKYGTERPGDGLRRAPTQPTRFRRYRGGSFAMDPGFALSSCRVIDSPSTTYQHLGVRPARTFRL